MVAIQTLVVAMVQFNLLSPTGREQWWNVCLCSVEGFYGH